MSAHPLDRPVWNALKGPQAHLARVAGGALRIDPDYGPFAAAPDDSEAGLAALAEVVGAGEAWLVETGPWSAPPGFRILLSAPLVQMVAERPAPCEPGDDEAALLGEADAGQMRDLALATEPGPWGSKTRHYGNFYGVKRDGKLMAMAGHRMRPDPGFAEVSAVCTWPEFQGQGLAARLIRRVMADMAGQGVTPFLHSYAANAPAIRLYEKLGFRIRREMVATVMVPA